MKFKDLALSYKFLLIFGLILIIFGAVSSYYRYSFESKEMIDDADIQNHLIQRTSVDMIIHKLKIGGSFNDATKGIADVVLKNPQIIFFEVTDDGGRIFASPNKSETGAISKDRHEIVRVAKKGKAESDFYVLPKETAAALQKKQKVAGINSWDSRPKVQELITPIKLNGRTVGVVHTYLSLTEMESRLKSAIYITLVTGSIITVFGLLIVLGLTYRYVQRPVVELSDTARRIADGEVTLRAKVYSKDEIGQLARSFNEMTEALIHLEFRADTDGLTGLYNYRHFQRTIEREMELSSRYRREFSFAILDLDFFKEVNDTYGHQKGDEVLRKVADYLKKSVRAADYVARYGGEEFAIIMPETAAGEAMRLCERLRQGMPREVKIESFSEKKIFASIGVGDFPYCAEDKEGLIAAADTALLFAKRSGRNQVTYFRDLSKSSDLRDEDLEKLFNRLKHAQLRTIEALSTSIEVEEGQVGHSQKVATSAAQLAKSLNMGKEEVEVIYQAGRIHDIGKVGVAKRILMKSETLTPAEIEAIKRHAKIGEEIIRSASKLEHLIPAILYHHERWDGSGYPRGLKGEDIPLDARIVAIAEAYEAMSSERPYHRAKTQPEAIAELKNGAGTQFDPKLVSIFVNTISRDQKKAG